MRVLVVTQDFPPVTGGIQNFIGNLADHLHPLVEHLAVVAPCAPGCKEHDLGRPYPVRRIAVHSSWLSLPLLVRLPTLARRERATHVLFAQWFPALGAGRLGGVATACIAHGRELLNHPLGALGLGLAPWVFSRMDLVLPVTAMTASILPGTVPPERIRIIHPGVDLEKFHPPGSDSALALRDRLGIAPRAPVVVSLARFVPRKGMDTLLQAFALLRNSLPEARLVLAGSGPDLPRLVKIAAGLGVSDFVVFPGRLPDADLPALLSLGVFALLSRQTERDVEGFGMVLVEAQACGSPVVAANSGGMPDAVGPGAGTIVPPDDPEAAANALSRYLLDPREAAAAGQFGRAFAQGLDWTSRAREVHAALCAITSRK